MNRRGGPIFGGGIFLIFAIGAFTGLWQILEVLIPIAIIYVIFSGFVGKSDNAPNQRRNNTNTSYQKTSSLSNADLNKIDNKLNQYFRTNLELPIVDGISLKTLGGKFTTADMLCITYKDEKVIKLIEFKDKYPDVYNKIMRLLLAFAKQKDEVLKSEVKAEPKKENVLSDADKYIEKINELNEAIPQEEITNGLYKTCDYLKQINLLKETKQDESKIRKLYDYYLPILVSILEKYKTLQDSPEHGQEFKDCEAQLIKTIILINEALKAIVSSMQEDDYMTINADINTLQSLLKKDGYGEDPFGGK